MYFLLISVHLSFSLMNLPNYSIYFTLPLITLVSLCVTFSLCHICCVETTPPDPRTKHTGYPHQGLTSAGPVSLLLRLVARCLNHPAPTHPLDTATTEPLTEPLSLSEPLSKPISSSQHVSLSEPWPSCVLTERRVKLALVRKHGGEALLVKAFLAETSGRGGTSASASASASASDVVMDENDMVRKYSRKSSFL